MKKRVFLLMIVVAAVIGMQAQDYYYTHTARFKAQGENQVINGNFEQFFEGWTNETGGEVNTDVWAVEPQGGPNGENAVIALQAGDLDGGALAQLWTLDPGLYIVSYYIKAESTQSTSLTWGAANYLNIYLNSDGTMSYGSNSVTVTAAEPFGTDWTQVVCMAQVEPNQQLVFLTGQMGTGTMIANIEVRQATEVYDVRLAQRQVDFAEKLLAEESLSEGRDEVIGALEGMIKPAIADNGQNEDFATMESLMELFEKEVFTPFLDANGTQLVGRTLTDWSEWGGANYNSMTNRGTWTFEGGRWGFFPNDAFAVSSGTTTLEFNPGDGYIATAGIQTGQPALNVGVRTLAGALDEIGPGKYMFSIEAQAVAASNRANPYGANHSIAIVGPNIYVGEDNEVLENDTLNGYFWKTYYKIAEIKDGEELKVGFHFPVLEGSTGGRYSLRNPQVRLLGVTADEAEFNRLKNAFMVQQYNLSLRLTTYPEELKDYPWDQDVLTAVVEQARAVYEASLQIIDANGNVLQRDMVNEEQTQKLLDEVNNLGRARSTVLTSNAPIIALREAVEGAKVSLANPANSAAPASYRSALEQAVATGEALLANITSENQGELFTETANNILKLQEEFEATAASRNNPTNILIANADFSEFGANSNITAGGENKSWQWTIGDGMGRWEIRDNETLEQGHGATCWRGTTAGPNGRVLQTAELTYEGLYEYRAKAYISEERVNELVAAAKLIMDASEMPIDTIYKPGIRLFFGQEGAPDSVTISKCYMGVKDDGTYFARTADGKQYPGQVYATYSVFFNKQGAAAAKVEFGLEAFGNSATAGANGFGFGMNEIRFLGNEAQYLADTKAEMDNLVASVNGAIGSVDNYWAVKVRRYIEDAATATTAKEMQNVIHSLKEVAARAGIELPNVEGIYEIVQYDNLQLNNCHRLVIRNGKVTIDGRYDLMGRKLNVEN